MPKRYQQGCVDVIQIDERFTTEELPAIEVLLKGVLEGRLPQVVLDLRRVRLIDSAGLELLLEAQQMSVARGGALQLAAPSALIRDILRITGVDEVISSHNDVVTAAGAFAL